MKVAKYGKVNKLKFVGTPKIRKDKSMYLSTYLISVGSTMDNHFPVAFKGVQAYRSFKLISIQTKPTENQESMQERIL